MIPAYVDIIQTKIDKSPQCLFRVWAQPVPDEGDVSIHLLALHKLDPLHSDAGYDTHYRGVSLMIPESSVASIDRC